MRQVRFDAIAFEQYTEWAVREIDVFKKITTLIKESQRDPFKGTGKPEPLKGNLKGHWSRRITAEHRLIYRVTDSEIVVTECYGHYI
jgi:toxin YoeB